MAETTVSHVISNDLVAQKNEESNTSTVRSPGDQNVASKSQILTSDMIPSNALQGAESDGSVIEKVVLSDVESMADMQYQLLRDAGYSESLSTLDDQVVKNSQHFNINRGKSPPNGHAAANISQTESYLGFSSRQNYDNFGLNSALPFQNTYSNKVLNVLSDSSIVSETCEKPFATVISDERLTEPFSKCAVNVEETVDPFEEKCQDPYPAKGFPKQLNCLDCSSLEDVFSLREGNSTPSVWSMESSSVAKDSIDRLPPEVMVKIFSYFSQKELCRYVIPVCKSWKDFGYDPIHWQAIVCSFENQISKSGLMCMIPHAPLLKKLALRHSMTLTLQDLNQIFDRCPLVEDLDMGFFDHIDRVSVDCIALKCRHLKSLNIEGCDAFGDDSAKILSQIKSLKSLNVSHCTLISNEAVCQWAENLNGIEHLNIDGIPSITDWAIGQLVKHQSDTLKYLEIDGAELTNESMFHLSKCSKVKKLTMSFAERLTDNGLAQIQNMTLLTELKLRKAAEFSSVGLCYFFENLKLKQLEDLDLSECHNINDEVVASLARSCGPSLLKLSLCWCWLITEAGVAHIVEHCRSLTHLILPGLDKITGESFERIPTLMKDLLLLDLQQCNQINDDKILSVRRQKPELLVIDYYGEEFED